MRPFASKTGTEKSCPSRARAEYAGLWTVVPISTAMDWSAPQMTPRVIGSTRLICRRGGPRHGPPHPPTLGAPRGTRGAPRRPARGFSSVDVGGPDMAPHTPPRSARPGEPVALLDD